VPERVGSKVLPIPTKNLSPLRRREEAVGEEQEPPRIYAGEVSGKLNIRAPEQAAPYILGPTLRKKLHIFRMR